MAASLPLQIVLGRPNANGSASTYLEYVLQKGTYNRRMKLSSLVVTSERNFTRLNMVWAPASVGNDMVHIRSNYNNKFLVLESEHSDFFVAGADEYEEDLSKWSCTLFKVTFDSSRNELSLLHQSSNSQHSVRLSSNFLHIVRNATQPYWFEVTDMNSLAILPKYVAFKGDNGLYLQSIERRLRNRLHFALRDRLDVRAHHETIPLNNGNIRLKSLYFNQLWRKSKPEWIWCDTNDTNAYDLDTTYRPVKLDSKGTTIALQNMGNKRYCMRWVRGGQPKLVDTLTASASEVESLTRMNIEEAVRERVIDNIRYNVEDARIYNVELHENSNYVNEVYNYSQERAVQKVGFTFQQLYRHTFESSHSWKLAFSTELKVRFIPVLVEGNINIDATYAGDVKWSETKETTIAFDSSVYVDVPPLSMVKVVLLIGEGHMDIPFSYTQHDIHHDGTSSTTHLDDGLFHGTNTVSQFIINEPIKLSELPQSKFEEARRDSLGIELPEEDQLPQSTKL